MLASSTLDFTCTPGRIVNLTKIQAARLAAKSGSHTVIACGNDQDILGRLIAGAWLPFALLYVRGFEVALGALPARLRGAGGVLGLGLVLGVCLGSELWLARDVFASAYNVFHLPAAP